jgi:hypothetical protein
LASKSKIPPKLADPLLEIGELVGHCVETLCFHDAFPSFAPVV